MKSIVRGLALWGLALCAGCAVPSKPAPLPGPRVQAPVPSVSLTKTVFSRVPGWQMAASDAGLAAFRASCREIVKRSPAAPMGGLAGTAADWRDACQAAAEWNGPAKAFFESRFTPAAVAADAEAGGLFTGYYEPEIAASHTRHGAFQTPVYARPSDLIEVNLGDFRLSLKGERIAGRVAGGRLVPFAARAEIETKGLPSAPVLFYTDDPVDLFFLQIQGSGRARFDDGTMMRVSYAGQNGWPYTAIGKVLLAQGALSKDELSLVSLKAWLRLHPAEGRTVMNADASYVFFKLAPLGDPALGAVGAEAVALTPQASMAVDAKYHGLGVPFFLSTTLADGRPFSGVLVAQDRGGAIRGAVRGDIFFGAGAEAETLAGGMKAKGKLYVLLPQPLADRLADKTVYPEVR